MEDLTTRTAVSDLQPPNLQHGIATALGMNPSYRVGRIARPIVGRWLDYGCADGGYAEQLLSAGAHEVVGVDVERDRIEQARARDLTGAQFLYSPTGLDLPFEDAHFDGAFVNEVLEHVEDERASLGEVHRLLKPGGRVVVISPNRWFPFEGHTVHFGKHSMGPAPLIPWLPKRLTWRHVEARNYWPRELIGLVRDARFVIAETGYIWPILDVHPGRLPRGLIEVYQRYLGRLDRLPGLRRFGVSTLVVGVKPATSRAT
jgi:SAM-dependent methyltransferase